VLLLLLLLLLHISSLRIPSFFNFFKHHASDGNAAQTGSSAVADVTTCNLPPSNCSLSLSALRLLRIALQVKPLPPSCTRGTIPEFYISFTLQLDISAGGVVWAIA
jgi:hypothetical protein